MREFRTPKEARLERIVRGLSVFTFILLCWTINRATRPRETCVNSNFIRAVMIEGQRVDNCDFESRLRLDGPKLSAVGRARLHRIESIGPMTEWFKAKPTLLIDISDKEPRAFGLYRGALRLGAAWVDEGTQVRRALAMAILKSQPAYAEISHFQLEVLADFVVLAAFGNARWSDRHGGEHDYARDLRLSTAARTFADYCRSPYRSLAHDEMCRANGAPDPQNSIWGARAQLSASLANTFSRLTLPQKMRVIGAVRDGVVMPKVTSPAGPSIDDLVEWFRKTTRAHAGALQILTDPTAEASLRRTFDDLEVGAPTRWDVTIDLRNTPRWREILKQLTARAHFRPNERELVFTPAGEIALPSGLPVHWTAREVDSRKHVLIACQFPSSDAALKVRAPRFFARQTCGTLSNSFWD